MLERIMSGSAKDVTISTKEGKSLGAQTNGGDDYAQAEGNHHNNNGKSAKNATTTATSNSTTADSTMNNTESDSAAEHNHCYRSAIPSVSLSIFVFWILPVILIAIFARFFVDTTPPPVRHSPSTNIPIKFDSMPGSSSQPAKKKKKKPKGRPSNDGISRRNSGGPRIVRPTAPSKTPTTSTRPTWPTSYKKVVKTITRRRRKLPHRRTSEPDAASSSSTSSYKASRELEEDNESMTPKQRRQRFDDPQKEAIERNIAKLRREHKDDPSDVLKTIALADILREREYIYHDGGTYQQEALTTYQHAIELTLAKREKLIAEGEPTNVSLSGTTSARDEVMLHYSAKSVDGLLCSLYTNKGKVYFLASMFEKAEEHYSKALELESLYLDAMGSRGSCRIILGKYAEAGQDLWNVIEHDEPRVFMDAFTGMARVLAAKESSIPQGWEPLVEQVHKLIPTLESKYDTVDDNAKNMLGGALDRLHHVLFTYHDVKTMDTTLAWKHLTTGYKYKLAALPKWNGAFEREKLTTAKLVFHKGFWTDSIGSDSVYPIFIIGFVRSGSTLLERVLDAHPRMVGLGEDSVFNGKLGYIRDTIVEASVNQMLNLPEVVENLAIEVVSEMKKRWTIVDSNIQKDENETGHNSLEPLRGVDKMLTNYMNVGFIHMLFPKALILHVAREPMDSVFSAFKHEFPPGTLEYTANFQAVSDLYLAYREVMEHWDEVLPGRVTHIRYEDMVRDMPGVARAIIKATGLEWDEGVLEFHKKKHAVNTYSSTQVREGVYTKAIESWRRYEEQLQPLVKLLGTRVTYSLKTTLPHYKPMLQGDEL